MKTLLLSTLLLCPAFTDAQDAPPTEPTSVALRFAPESGDYLRITLSESVVETKPPAALGPDADPQEKLNAEFAPKKQTVTARETGYDWKIEDRDTEGNTVITVSYAYIRVTTTVGKEVQPSLRQFGEQDVVYPGETYVRDTRQEIMSSNPTLEALSKQPAEQQPPGKAQKIAQTIANLERLQALSRSFIARPFTIVVSAEGKLLAVRGMDVIMDQFRNELSKGKAELAQQAERDAWIEAFFGDDTVSKTLTLNLLLPFPAGPVNPGDTWSDQHEFEVSGLKVPVMRKMSLEGPPGPEGTVRLSGVMEIAFQATARALYKDRLVIDARGESMRLNAEVEMATGMYRKLDTAGSFVITARAPGAAPGAAPGLYINQRLVSSAVATRLAKRDPNDKAFWLFEGGHGAYQLRLGLDWVQRSTSDGVGEMVQTVYWQARSGAQLTTSVAPPSAQDEQDHPLAEYSARVKSLLERTWQGSLIQLSWSKLFDTGLVRWARCRVEITKPTGEQQAYWSQDGYGPQGHYTFEFFRPGVSSEETDEEVTKVFDSIVIPESIKP